MASQDDINRDEYIEEQEKLASVVNVMRESADRLRGRKPVIEGDVKAADAVHEMLNQQISTLESALNQPYFGRLNYLVQDPAEQEPRVIYIGRDSVPDTNVWSWAAPVAGLWYTNDSKYTAPKREIRVRVDLKRFLRIRDQQVVEVSDIYRRALPAGGAAVNPALISALSGTGPADGHLTDIVETIQPEQYERIANVTDQVLIVQGAAGSGKSEIGFHRIAFLLSPFNGLPERDRPTPATTIFIGPSDSFLEYASDVLPSLGVSENIRQTTIRQWLIGHHSKRLTFNDRIWKNLLEKGKMIDYGDAAESFKGSMVMADSLGRHVRQLTQDVRRETRDLPDVALSFGGMRITVSESEVRTVRNRILPSNNSAAPLNLRRREFTNAIIDIAVAKSGLVIRTRGQSEGRIRRQLSTTYLEPWLAPKWPEFDFRQEYANLISDPVRLSHLSHGEIGEEAQNLHLHRNDRDGRYEFEDSDIGALTYLDHLLNDTIIRRNRHVVVDEAQDISPIEFMLLRISSLNDWFTILGDTAQRLTPYLGIRRWRDLERPLGRSKSTVQHARTSYRANQHITRFNNRILRQFDTYINAPVAFGREGHRVEYHRHASRRDMHPVIARELERIRSLEGLTNAQIAILVRDLNNLWAFEAFCRDNGIDEVVRFGSETPGSKTILARIPETKGLEYDAVIVLGVNDRFTDTDFNKKLLYIAATRAKHYLAIHGAGGQSPIMRAISERGVLYRDHR